MDGVSPYTSSTRGADRGAGTRATLTHRTLVSTDALADHLELRPPERPDGVSWVVVDCRFDLHNDQWGRGQYRSAHIPGAVYASLNEDLAGPRTGGGGRHPLPSVDALATTFGRLGISRDMQVVVYDQDTGLFASRFWWSLKYLGHEAVAVLDGGFAKWLREGRPTRSGDESRRPTTFDATPRPEMCVDVDRVAARAADPTAVLIDARSPDRFEGRNETIDRIAGHIPGATNVFYKSNLSDEGTMLPPEALRARYEGTLAGRPPRNAIMYCGSGVSACVNLLAMEHAGLPGARLYVGSWSEWSSDPTRPIETGPSSAQASSDKPKS